MTGRESLLSALRNDRAYGFFGNRLVYWRGASRLWGRHSWVGGRMFCVGKWVVYFEDAE